MDDGRNDPAILALEAEIGETTEEIDRAKMVRDKAQAKIDEHEARLMKLRTGLNALTSIMKGETPVTATPDATTTGTRKKLNRTPLAELQRQARDVIAGNPETQYTIKSLAPALDIGLPRSKELMEWAVAQGIAEVVQEGGPGGKAFTIQYKVKPNTMPLQQSTGPVDSGGVGGLRTTGGAPLQQVTRHPDKDYAAALAPAIRAGAKLVMNGGPHYKLKQDGKPTIIVPSTASDHRSIKNLRADMRRAGYAVTG